MGLPGGSNAELSCNILVVRFRCPGTVVWVSPLEICTWNRPGQLLCAVQLEETKTVVPVRVPNFDLRFDLESAWFPSKGMVSGPGLDRKALKRAAFVGEADMPEMVDNGSDKVEVEKKHLHGDGFNAPIRVSVILLATF